MEPIAATVSTEGPALSMAKREIPRDSDAARAWTDSLEVRKAALFFCMLLPSNSRQVRDQRRSNEVGSAE
jgi:hypothetical protein